MLWHIRSYLELLTADVADLINALYGKPGEASALAAKLLDDPDDLCGTTLAARRADH
jgi:hypothetical protein